MNVDRETAVAMMEALGAIDTLLGDCRHDTVVKIKSHMAVFEQVADDAFPGGYACECIYCEAPIGHEEAVYLGEERCCQDCWKQKQYEMDACSHEYGPDTDEHGDPIRSCSKCGHAVDVKDYAPEDVTEATP